MSFYNEESSPYHNRNLKAPWTYNGCEIFLQYHEIPAYPLPTASLVPPDIFRGTFWRWPGWEERNFHHCPSTGCWKPVLPPAGWYECGDESSFQNPMYVKCRCIPPLRRDVLGRQSVRWLWKKLHGIRHHKEVSGCCKWQGLKYQEP